MVVLCPGMFNLILSLDGTGYYDYGDDDDFEEEEEYGKVSSSKSDRKTLEEKKSKFRQFESYMICFREKDRNVCLS